MTNPDTLTDQLEGTDDNNHQSAAVYAGVCTLERVAELKGKVQPASDVAHKEEARLEFVFSRWGVNSE